MKNIILSLLLITISFLPAAAQDACADYWDPVCGSDGKTYSNECYALLAGIETFTEGLCISTERASGTWKRANIVQADFCAQDTNTLLGKLILKDVGQIQITGVTYSDAVPGHNSLALFGTDVFGDQVFVGLKETSSNKMKISLYKRNKKNELKLIKKASSRKITIDPVSCE